MMRDFPFVSVVVPTWNRANMVGDCLQSLFAQDYPRDRYEVIVVDDGSTDETPMIAAALAAKVSKPEVRVLTQDHQGLNSSRNAALAIAIGNPICFIDDDVDAPPHWLRAMVDGSRRHPDAGCVGGPIRLRLEGRAPRLCGREPLGETELDLGDSERAVDYVWGANMAITRRAIALAGPFDESLPICGDEVEWEHRLRSSGAVVVYVPDAWLWHRRLASDVVLTRLMRSRFVRGRNQVSSFKRIGKAISISSEGFSALRAIAHAVRYQCAGGLLAASRHCGSMWGLMRQSG